MRGYCVLSIGNLNLCSFIDEEEAWVGLRDIEPAAFDKRIEGYKSIIKLHKVVFLKKIEIINQNLQQISQ